MRTIAYITLFPPRQRAAMMPGMRFLPELLAAACPARAGQLDEVVALRDLTPTAGCAAVPLGTRGRVVPRGEDLLDDEVPVAFEHGPTALVHTTDLVAHRRT